MSTKFASAELTAGQLNAIVKKLGGHDAAIKFLQGEMTVSEPTCKWHEQNGVIYLNVTSDGTTGYQWIKRFENKGYPVGKYAKSVLRSKDFKPTSGETTRIAILRGMLFEDHELRTNKIRAFAAERNLKAPNAEVACLIREIFSREMMNEMGLWWIVVMHEPITIPNVGSRLLDVDTFNRGEWLNTFDGKSEESWSRGHSFVFAVS